MTDADVTYYYFFGSFSYTSAGILRGLLFYLDLDGQQEQFKVTKEHLGFRTGSKSCGPDGITCSCDSASPGPPDFSNSAAKSLRLPSPHVQTKLSGDFVTLWILASFSTQKYTL